MLASGSAFQNDFLSSMKLEDLKDLYIHELKDLHGAEKQITKALHKMAEAAGSDELATAFR